MRETVVVWSPWDFFGSPTQHHRSPGAPQSDRNPNTEGIPTSLASWAWRPPPGQDSWSMCLSSNRGQAGRHFSRLDMEYSISNCREEPLWEAGLAKRCRGTRSSWPLSWVFSALCSEMMVSALWPGWELFTKNSAQRWISSQLERVSPGSAPSCLSTYKGLTFARGAPVQTC